jgi:2-polyprenyl-3-methyl-5-hydroxy-6-metoxy-1,4-benzoquinol methylase
VLDLIKRVAFGNPALLSIIQSLRKRKAVYNEKGIADFVKEFDLLYKVVDDKAIAYLRQFYYRITKRLPLGDPFSESYRDAQMHLYRDISGTSAEYSYSNEVVPHPDYSEYRFNPFPYCVKSPDLIGEMLCSHGFAIRTMNLSAHSRVVEFGAGWGNITYQLAMSGCDMTAVDVSKELLNLLRERIEGHNKQASFVQSDMYEFARSCTKTYDAVLFTESFHHCSNHEDLIKQVSRIVPSGIIVFVNEPIFNGPSPTLPYPWGIRLDGQSIYFIRKLKWLELGFQYGYLRKLLLKYGWELKRHINPDKRLPAVYIARRSIR